MNADRCGRAVLAALLVALLAGPSAAAGFEDVGELAPPFQDPLLAVPNELTSGVVLPGDGQPAPCPAVKDFATPLALTEAVDLALCNNAQVKAAWANIKVQAAATGVARAAYFPTLAGSLSHREDRTSFPDSTIKTRTIDSSPINGAFTWRLFDFGGRGANHDAAVQSLAAALANHNAVLQKTLAAVVQAYFDAQATRAAWQAKEQNEEIARSTLETARRRETKGAGSTNDTLQAATALARATLEKNRAQGTYHKALAVLIYGIGVPLHTRVTLANDLEEPIRQAADDLEAWLQEAENRHPAINAARAQLAAARHRVTATRSEGLPTLDFSANYYENGRLEQTSTDAHTRESVVGITLNIPLFDGFSRTYKVRGAEAQVEQRWAELQDTEHQIAMDMVKAHADAVAALANLEASAKLLSAAQEALQTSRRKYEKGAADILEMLTTQTALAEARQERIRSLAEWRSARLRMLASAGMMGRADITP